MTTLGKYELHEELGRGGFGIVYRAVDTTLGREVALKVLHPQLTVDPDFLEKFRNEARVIASLDSPNIVTIYEMGETDGRIFIAMRYMTGGSLKDKLAKEGKLSFEETLRIMKQVCAGLQVAHEKGLVHRDIKPANILFDSQGNTVISDFGLAKAVQDSSVTAASSAGGMGTPAYRAPELWEGDTPATPETDIYSMGCVLFEMLTGKVLFDGDTSEKILVKHLLNRPNIASCINNDFSSKVVSVIEKSTAKYAKERFVDTNVFFWELKLTQNNIIDTRTKVNNSRKIEKEDPENVEKKKARDTKREDKPKSRIILLLGFFGLLLFLSITFFYRKNQLNKKQSSYESYYQQAQETADMAKFEQDPIKQHDYWTQTLQLVISAEKYNVTQESRMLYEQAQYLLDEMDLAARLDFRPALTQFFPEGMVITNIQASSSGVYLLDKTSGSILRIFLNTKGFYEIDDEFKCQPGPYGLETVTNLVDFVPLPANPDNYRVMAVDANGNLLYCRPGEVPVSRTLAPPENGWGHIAGVGFDNNVLYVLDSGNDAIWMYVGKNPNQPNAEASSGIVFAESPIKFLDEESPELGDALDLVINQLDIFILHQDGHMTTCRYGPDKAVRLTECQDPTPYTDNRVGRPDKKPWIFPNAFFVALQAVRVPDASIYILDSGNTTLYQFSYQLNMEHVLRPQYNRSHPLPDSQPSGFGVSPDQDLFLAFDNELYISSINN